MRVKVETGRFEVAFYDNGLFFYRFWAVRDATPIPRDNSQNPALMPKIFAGHCSCRDCIDDPACWNDVSLRHHDFKKVSAYIAYMSGKPIEEVRAYHQRQHFLIKQRENAE